MNLTIFVPLLIAHVLGDFYLQNDKQCRNKDEKKFRSPYLYVHSLVIGLLSWLMVSSSGFWWCAVVIAFSHCVIDLEKSYMTSRGLSAFVCDQLAHIAVMLTVAIYWEINDADSMPLISYVPSVWGAIDFPMFFLVVLLCLKPANIFIKLVLARYNVGESKSCSEIRNAGALIGNLERLLTLILVIFGQFDAVGFVVAAKSLLRFKDTDTAKTEYVLAGTFLSFGIAVVLGLCVKL